MAKESTFKNMLITLLLVTFISSTGVAYVYELTKEPIAKASLAKKILAIKEVVPAFTNNPLEDQYSKEVDGGKLVFYPAKNNNELVGTAVETFTNQGFGGEVKLMVGFQADGTIYNIAVVKQSETPGLGDKMEKNKSNFTLQFKGENPNTFRLKVKKDGGDVDGITAATISSRAFCDAVQRAVDNFKS